MNQPLWYIHLSHGVSATVLELLAREDQALLVRRDALLVLDLVLHHVDRVARLDLWSDGLARQGLDENLHATEQTQHQVKGRLLLDLGVVGDRADNDCFGHILL